jgi:cold shock CspA family protein
MIGTIEIYFKEKGYGFCKWTNTAGIRKNYFFHINDVISGEPVQGAEIHFDEQLDPTKNKSRAVNVQIVNGGV